MSLQQKNAWFNLVVVVLAVVTYFVLWPVIGPWRAMGAFGLLGLAGLSGFFYIRAKRSGRVISDERDQMINVKAFAVAKSVIWVGLIAACMLALYLVGEHGSVPVEVLAMVVWWSTAILLFVHSLTTLILYTRQ